MPRGKGKKNEDAQGTSQRPTGNCTWVNVRLTDEDVLELSERDVTPDDIVGWIIDLSRIGADIGVKWADNGASRMAYCIVPDSEGNSRLLGVSAYGTDAYDALLALMFKVDIKLERMFTAPSDVAKPRFR